MITETRTYFHFIPPGPPAWMLETDRALRRPPGRSLLACGAPPCWSEAMEAMSGAIAHRGVDAKLADQAIRVAPDPWPTHLQEKVRRISTEPLLPHDGVHMIATGRGLRLLAAPRPLTTAILQEGALIRVIPWGRPNLTGWTRFSGESEALDPDEMRPWVWAAWACGLLLELDPAPSLEPEKVADVLKRLAAIP